jgi:hypothetical protein
MSGEGRVVIFNEITGNDPVIEVRVPYMRQCAADRISLRMVVRRANSLVVQSEVATWETMPLNSWTSLDLVHAFDAPIHAGDSLILSIKSESGTCVQFVKPIELAINALSTVHLGASR